ncbi:MAG: tetratricopeptide repeat protein, partial [Candidatus Baltobacteraceae bacterium]
LYGRPVAPDQLAAALAEHPDAVADASWNLGILWSRAGRPERALQAYRAASALAPFAAKYLLAAAFQELDLHRTAQARNGFLRAIDVDPASADAYAGAGMAALVRGDRALALHYARRSAAIDPRGHALRTLERALR